MSLVQDITTALEALIRAAIPTIPAGSDGVSLVMRLPQDLNAANCPHLCFGGEEERSVALRFLQQRVTVTLGVVLIRRGATHAELLADYGAIRSGFDADHTCAGVIETGVLELIGISEANDERSQELGMRFAGTKVI